MSPGREYVAIVRTVAQRPLAERISLLADAGITTVIAAGSAPEAIQALGRLPRSSAVYALDLDSVTFPVIAWALAQRRHVVLDLGDDAYALARAGGQGRLGALPRLLADAGARRTVTALVHRGRLHPVLRALPARSIWCPDTVPDAVLERTLPAGDPQMIATFGSIGNPDSSGWAYGRELVDALESNRDLRGTIIGRGPGVAFFRRLAGERALRERLTVLDEMPLDDLVTSISAARFVTSYQSDDRAGWVRTTGKLPLALGSGRALISTDVGEGALALPPAWRLREPRARFGAAVADRVAQLGDTPAHDTARELAEVYRRSTVAARLRAFLDSIDERP